jgi:CubicO group peptidase (beta-lactamase class C family)
MSTIMREWFLATAVYLLLCGALFGADVDGYIRTRMQENHIPGLALAVIREGTPHKIQGYGFSNLELGTRVTPETVFEIGSITKQFTATLVLLLANDGRLNLDRPAVTHLPGAPAAWQRITIRHLLTHTSGLTNYTGLSGFEMRRKLDSAGFVKELGRHPLIFEPGSAWSYCNSGYNLLGYVIEAAVGKSYWEVLRERICEPAGITSIQNRDPETMITNRAAGYEWTGGKLMNRDADLTDVFAAGAAVSTITDMVRWNAALESEKIVPAVLRDQLWSPVLLNNGKTYPYGLGWRLQELHGRKAVGHSGSTSGFSAGWLRIQEPRLAVIVLCNQGEEGLGMSIARGVASLYL